LYFRATGAGAAVRPIWGRFNQSITDNSGADCSRSAKPSLARLKVPFYRPAMTPKQKTIQALGTLPEDVSYEQLQEEVKVLAALDEGESDIRNGKVVSHEEVKHRLAQWTSS
jgi:hypothetical protein